VRQTSYDILVERRHFPVKEQPHKPKDAWLYLCPFHADTDPSFSVHENGNQWKCWVCGIGGGPGELRRLFGDNYVAPPKPAPAQKESKKSDTQIDGCTLAQLAEARGFTVKQLRSVGWYEEVYQGKTTITMPYKSMFRRRVSLNGGVKVKSQYRKPLELYDPHNRLEEIRRGEWVLFVEGETDTVAGWLIGLPVIGVPGASSFKKEWALQFQGIKEVYAWKEPDQGGETFVNKLAEAFCGVKVIEPPDGIKDLCELHDQAGEGALDFFNELKAEAKPYRYTIDDGQRWGTTHDAAADQPFDGAGTGRRRFTGAKGAEVRQTRDRHGKIWLEAHRRLGDTNAITRARDCGGLWGRECDNGHVTAPAEKERSTCKQRLHPRCLGTVARKAFYFPKTRGPTTLDGEGDMDINIVQPGRYDVREDPFEWAPSVRRQMVFIREHIDKLRDRKGTPQCFKDAYIGWRVDLRRGCLTLDLVIVGGRDPAMSEWLKDAFAEIAAEPVQVETLHPLDHSALINDFGNLMSSAVAYSDVEECLAMLEALKNWRLVQPQGKFLGKKAAAKAEAEKKSLDVSIGGQPQVPIETSRDPASAASGGGPTHPPCPECGRPTRSAGFKTGHWSKVVGRYSKQLTWMLMADDADPGGGAGDGFQAFQKDVAQAREEYLVQVSEEMVI
jgi:hypothetical protein